MEEKGKWSSWIRRKRERERERERERDVKWKRKDSGPFVGL